MSGSHICFEEVHGLEKKMKMSGRHDARELWPETGSNQYERDKEGFPEKGCHTDSKGS